MQKEFKTDWNKLNNLNDNEIDYSDIPEKDEEFWQSADYVVPRKKIDITLKN